MKKTTSPFDILNSFSSNRPYAASDKEEEAKEAISKKYGGEVNRYIKEPYNIKIQFLDGFKKVWQDAIINKTGNQPKQWTAVEWELKAKILDKESVQNMLQDTIKKLDSYEAQLEKQGQQIKYSDDMKTAEQIAGQIKEYHDSNIADIFTQTEEALHEFEVEAMGILDQ